MKPELPRHIARLDVLRALAFLAVYAYHFSVHFQRLGVPFKGLFRDYQLWPKWGFPLLPVSFGWLGVTLFFVLSGFCIHYATLRRKEPFAARDFFWRRALRLYPAYFVCVVTVTALAPWLHDRYFNLWQVPMHLLLIHNFLKYTFFGLNGSLWSLAVEAQFYLLYPLLLVWQGRRFGLDRCLAFALVLNVLCQIYFSFHENVWHPVRATWSFPLVTWCDWILGAALAEAYVKGKPLFARTGLWLIGSGFVLILALQFKTLNVQAYLFGSVFSGVLMQRYLAIQAPLHWSERLLIPVGLISYSLYLWHEPIINLVNQWGANNQFLSTPIRHAFFDLLVTTAFLAPIAWASYFLLEVRAPALIRRFAAKRHLTDKPLPLPGIVESSHES